MPSLPSFCSLWGLFLLATPPPPISIMWWGCICPWLGFGHPPWCKSGLAGSEGTWGGAQPHHPSQQQHPGGSSHGNVEGTPQGRVHPRCRRIRIPDPTCVPTVGLGLSVAPPPPSPSLCRREAPFCRDPLWGRRGWWPGHGPSPGRAGRVPTRSFQLPEGDTGTMSPKNSFPGSQAVPG